MSYEIDISDRQIIVPIDIDQLTRAVVRALEMEQIVAAVLSVSIVDNQSIHRINREHLQHDYPTDVISFQLDFTAGQNDPRRGTESSAELRARGAMIEGEIIASAQMAAEMASSGHWTAMNELTLYVVHGLLHICGYDDLSHDERTIMRRRETAVLNTLSLQPVYPDDD